MHKKLSRLIEPNLQPYFFCLATFAGVTAPFQPVLAVVELAALVLLYLLYRSQSTRRRHNVMRYIETITGGVDSISKNSMLNTPPARGGVPGGQRRGHLGKPGLLGIVGVPGRCV